MVDYGEIGEAMRRLWIGKNFESVSEDSVWHDIESYRESLWSVIYLGLSGNSSEVREWHGAFTYYDLTPRRTPASEAPATSRAYGALGGS